MSLLYPPQAYKESSRFLYSNFSSMSRHISYRYLLYYLCVSAILACGLSRRIPRRASCPSCSQDCPEALTVQLPWYFRPESDQQSVIPRDFSTNQNSLYSRLMQERMSQDNNVLSNENAVSFGNYRSNPRSRASTSGNLIFNTSHANNNKLPESVERRTISQNDFTYEYPSVYVSPSQVFDTFSGNMFLQNPRDKNAEFSSPENQNFQDSANKMLHIVYRADENTKPSWENLKDASSSSNIILPQRSFPTIENAFRLRRQDILDEKKSAIEKSPANQEYDFAYLGKEYYPTNFDGDKIKPDYIVPQIQKYSTKNKEFFDERDTDVSLQSSNLRQLMQTKDDFLRMHPAEKQNTIITEGNNDENSYTFPQELNIWKPTEKQEFFNNWDVGARKNSQESAEMKQLQKVENNWLLPAMNARHFEKDEKYFEDEENMNQDYFYDDIEKDIVATDRNSHNVPYNPYALFQDMSMEAGIWRPVQEVEELSDDLDLTHGNLQDVPREKELEIYPKKNNDHFRTKENENVNIDKAHADADQIIRPYNANLLSRYLNIFKDPTYSAESSKTQELSKPQNNTHANSIEKRNKRLFKNDETKENPAPPTNIFYIRKYNSPVINTKNVETNMQNETLTKVDPDLLADVEEPNIIEPTEPTSTDSPAELSTSHNKQ